MAKSSTRLDGFTLLFAFALVAMVVGIGAIIFKGEPRRDDTLARQLQVIRDAQTIDDLRPLLEEIVRKQRNDYR